MELFFIVLLILLMMTALGSGFPVAFALPGSAIIAVGTGRAGRLAVRRQRRRLFTQDGPSQWLTAGVTNFRGVYWDPDRDTLIAIPLFVFMGIMLQRSRIAEDLLVTMAQLFGPVRGGLGISVVFVGALLAATTGIVGATVVAMGLISLPAMLRNNYSHPLATGTIAASGTLGQIIPPSIVLIILADQLAQRHRPGQHARARLLYKATTGEFTMPSDIRRVSTSAGEMFLGALVPGLLLVAVYIVFILVIAFLRPQIAPAVHYEGKYDLRVRRQRGDGAGAAAGADLHRARLDHHGHRHGQPGRRHRRRRRHDHGRLPALRGQTAAPIGRRSSPWSRSIVIVFVGPVPSGQHQEARHQRRSRLADRSRNHRRRRLARRR